MPIRSVCWVELFDALEQAAGPARQLTSKFKRHQLRLQLCRLQTRACLQRVQPDRIETDQHKQVLRRVGSTEFVLAAVRCAVPGRLRHKIKFQLFQDVLRLLDQLGALLDQGVTATRLR